VTLDGVSPTKSKKSNSIEKKELNSTPKREARSIQDKPPMIQTFQGDQMDKLETGFDANPHPMIEDVHQK
jgi:hypothetical protein